MNPCGLRRALGRALGAALLLLAVRVQAADGLVFSPAQWSVGSVPDTEALELLVTVRSSASASIQVSFVPTCDCLSADPGRADIPPGGERVFRLRFDPAGYAGDIDMDYVVRSTLPGMEKSLFRVYGEVRPAAVAGEPPAQSVAGGGDRAVVRLAYYYSPGCRSCERFLSEEVPALEAELGVALELERVDIFEPQAYEGYLRLLSRLRQQERAYPAIVAGERVLQGDREIEAGLREAVRALAAAGRGAAGSLAGGPAGTHRQVDLAILPVVAAGLLDGINPCAFTTLIFLISALAVAGRSRREVLLLGLFYSASVFVTYFLIGLGFLGAVRYAHSFALVAAVIRWALVAALAVFAVLSFHDFLRLRRGETAKVLLQLPLAMKRQIHASIRTRARSAALLGSALVLGFLVSVFELACTGQVYLPTIVYMVRAGRQLRGYAYLLLYNLGFVVPLLVVFALSFAGLSLKGLSGFFQKSMAGVKLALAVLFTALAALTVLL